MKTTSAVIEEGVRGRLGLKEDVSIVMKIVRFSDAVKFYDIQIETPEGENLGRIWHYQVGPKTLIELLQEWVE